MLRRNWIGIAAIAPVLLLALSACGRGSSSTNGGATSDPGRAEPAAQFLAPGKPHGIASFGSEAGTAERRAASAVLAANLRARAAGNWAAQCSSLAAPVAAKVEKEGRAAGTDGGCAKGLEAAATRASPSVLEDTMTGPVDALRVREDSGWALYHGRHGLDYAIPMRKEGGRWKVASLVTVKVP